MQKIVFSKIWFLPKWHMTSLVDDMDPLPVSAPPGSTIDPSVVLEMFYVFPLYEPFRLSPTSGCHFWVSILTRPAYVLNYLYALHWFSQCFIYHLYNDNQHIYICRPGFTPSYLIRHPRSGESTMFGTTVSAGNTSLDVCWGQTYHVMAEASQVHSFYINTLFTYQLCENFLPTHKNIYLLPLFLKQHFLGISILPLKE